jgi:enoyl-CoA hydratase
VESVHNSAPREVIADSGIYRARHGNRIELVLARGHVGNTLDAVALHAANTVLREARDDDTVAGLVIRSTATNFCSGGDFFDSGRPGELSPDYGPQIEEFTRLWCTRQYPVLAVVDGPARAFGCAIALTADLAVVRPEATFALPELGNGLVPVYAIALLRHRHGSAFVRGLTLTRRALTAEEAHASGIVSDLTDGAERSAVAVAAYVAFWDAVGPTVTRHAMRTLARFDSAASLEETLHIAREGLTGLLERVRRRESSQSYLDADRAPSPAAE